MVATDELAFGDDVPAALRRVRRRDARRTPFEVVAEFFPTFAALDKFETVDALAQVPTSDHLRHRGQDHLDRPQPQAARAASHGSDLLECEGAGHMVIIERHDQVNAELDQLIARAPSTG